MTSRFVCGACGYSAAKWFGKCPDCDEWSQARPASDGAALDIVTLADHESPPARRPTGSDEVDRVLGGGLVVGSVVLLAGEPGIGKSTLVLQLLASLEATSLLVTGEESIQQVGMRASRLGLDGRHLRVAATTSMAAIAAGAAAADVLVVDSIQTLRDDTVEGIPGSPGQVRGCAARLVELAKAAGTTVVLVGHVTKEGTVAGPKTLEHVVDVVLTLEGERSGSLRLLRSTKNRFGACDETGVFTMGDKGLEPVPDPSALFLADRDVAVPGSVVLPTIDGTRPVLVEIQALVASQDQAGRRSAIGLDPRRLSMMVGVLETRGDLALGRADVFVAAAGGLRVKEPAADLAMCVALHSARSGAVLDARTVVLGEVGLGGEIRRVHSLERRLAEAARMGFERAIVPHRNVCDVRGITTLPVSNLSGTLALLAELGSSSRAVSV